MDWTNILQIIGLVLLLLAAAYSIIALSYFVGDKDKLADIQLALGPIVGTTAIMILISGIFTYIYIRVNPQAFVPIVLFISFLALEASLVAVGTSVLAKSK
jgi:hypothetical protein